jgi:hypothetical protein
MKILPTTRSIISLLKDNKIIRLKKDYDRKTKYLNQVFEDFKNLSKIDDSFRCYESTSEPYEMMVVGKGKNSSVDTYII